MVDWELSRTVVWALLGVLLIILEMVTLNFVLLFFGVAGLVTAVARLCGIDNVSIEFLLFGLLGAAGVLFLRKPLLQTFPHHGHYTGDRAERLHLTSDVPPGGEVQVEYQGAPWTAINESSSLLKSGSKAAITRVEGVRLFIKEG